MAAGKPLYVIRICPKDNSITVGTRKDASRCDVQAEGVNVLIPRKLRAGQALYGKLRSYGKPSPCTVVDVRKEGFSVKFKSSQFAPTPGQHIVLYDDEGKVTAGGKICER